MSFVVVYIAPGDQAPPPRGSEKITIPVETIVTPASTVPRGGHRTWPSDSELAPDRAEELWGELFFNEIHKAAEKWGFDFEDAVKKTKITRKFWFGVSDHWSKSVVFTCTPATDLNWSAYASSHGFGWTAKAAADLKGPRSV